MPPLILLPSLRASSPHERSDMRVQRVGWVERSDTHQLHFMKTMGFAGLYPSYALDTNSPSGKSRRCSPDGAKRNPGPVSRESRISLRSIRATLAVAMRRASSPHERSDMRVRYVWKPVPDIASLIRATMFRLVLHRRRMG